MLDKKIDISCNDGCRIIRFNYDSEYKFLSIESFVSDYYGDGIWEKIKNRFKLIWYAIRGKEYLLYEIILVDKEVNEFKNKMDEFFNDK